MLSAYASLKVAFYMSTLFPQNAWGVTVVAPVEAAATWRFLFLMSPLPASASLLQVRDGPHAPESLTLDHFPPLPVPGLMLLFFLIQPFPMRLTMPRTLAPCLYRI